MPNSPDYDGAWKEALDAYFPGFMALLWPNVYAQIDWGYPLVVMDKELQHLARGTKPGRMHVDKLVRVRTLDKRDTLVLIHTEVQATRCSLPFQWLI